MNLNSKTIAISIAVMLITGCASAPLDYPKEASVAIADTSGGREAQEVEKWLGGRSDINGFYPLSEGFDAFGARLALMDFAEVSIDAQYFLMKPDNAGMVFAAKLMESADRGVRVRFLLDDIFTTVDDLYLAIVNEHPNVELRIFNPISRKGIYAFNYIGHFSLANRRMHNKSFVVDNQVAIVGGRNIANEYYQLETSGEFIDFDMLAVGPVVREVSSEFDTYWNHKLAVPFEALFKVKNPEKMAKARAELAVNMADAGESIYADAISTPLMKQFFDQTLPPYIAEARLLTDKPQKLLEPVSDDQQIVVNEMRDALLAAEEEIYIFTPYFIPRKKGIELIKLLRERGIRIVLLTNSLATNNHTSVHSAYAKYRKDLLKAGVELWEARADAAKITAPDGESQLDHLTLHTKGILIDRRRTFVGSLNLDPRSIDINTEMGLLIDSPELGAKLRQNGIEQMPKIAYRLRLDENDKITWHATIDGQEVVETKEPQTSGWKRFSAWFLKIAPEKQL
ncbi:MAG: phospholipase D family protein [Gammaproteobacteria bacterium]